MPAFDPVRQLALQLDQVERFTCPWCGAHCFIATSLKDGKRGVAHGFPSCVMFKHTPAARVIAIVHQQPQAVAS